MHVWHTRAGRCLSAIQDSCKIVVAAVQWCTSNVAAVAWCTRKVTRAASYDVIALACSPDPHLHCTQQQA